MKKVAIKCKSKKHGKKILKYFKDKGVDVAGYNGKNVGYYYCHSKFGVFIDFKIPEGYKEIKLSKKKNWVEREIATLYAEVNELKKHPLLNVPELQKIPSPFKESISILENDNDISNQEPTQEEKEIDWSIPGQIVSSDIYIVLTSGKEKGTDFGGMVISVKNKNLEGRVGFYSDEANKASFKLHKDPITLSN